MFKINQFASAVQNKHRYIFSKNSWAKNCFSCEVFLFESKKKEDYYLLQAFLIHQSFDLILPCICEILSLVLIAQTKKKKKSPFTQSDVQTKTATRLSSAWGYLSLFLYKHIYSYFRDARLVLGSKFLNAKKFDTADLEVVICCWKQPLFWKNKFL